MGVFTNYDGIIVSTKEIVTYFKTGSITSVAAQYQSTFAAAGFPAAGSLAVGNTTNGIVPVDNVTGVPNIVGWTGNAYLAKATFANTVAGNILVMDRLFSVGSITMTTGVVTTTLSSQPSYAARLPGTNYDLCEIWLETGATALSNHAHSVVVNYLDQGGAAGATQTISTQNLIAGRMLRLPLANGDSGVSQIVSIQANGVASATGTFNIHVMRPLAKSRILMANYMDVQGPDKTMLPEIHPNTSLYIINQPDSTATAAPYVELVLAISP